MVVRILAATVAGGLVFFLVGYVLFVMLVDPMVKPYVGVFPGFMQEPMPNMLYLVLWNLAMSFLFAYVFEMWAGIRTFVGGLKGGVVLMFLIAAIIDLQYLAFTNFWKNPIGAVIDIIAATLLGTLAAGVVGAVLGLMNKSNSTSQ